MTRKEIKELAQELMYEIDRKGLNFDITLGEDQLNKLTDSIIDRLLTTHMREQAMWNATSTMDEIFNHVKQKSKKSTGKNEESELLGELAKLMTQLSYHQENEEYEECAEIKKEIDIVNDKLSKL